MARKENDDLPSGAASRGDDEGVGYGRPPASRRFKPGQSGNPDGRPKGSRNKPEPISDKSLRDMILGEARREIKVQDGENVIMMSVAQAAVRSLSISAAKGNLRAQKLFLSLQLQIEASDQKKMEEHLLKAMTHQRDARIELERREACNSDLPHMLPHPDDIFIDMDTGLIHYLGPRTEEEQKVWRARRIGANVLKELMEELDAALQKPMSKSERRQTLSRLAAADDAYQNLIDMIGNWDR